MVSVLRTEIELAGAAVVGAVTGIAVSEFARPTVWNEFQNASVGVAVGLVVYALCRLAQIFSIGAVIGEPKP